MINNIQTKLYFLSLSIFIIIIDQFTKYLIFNNYELVTNKDFLLFRLDFVGISGSTLCCRKLTKILAFAAQACLSAGRGAMVQKGPIDLGSNSNCTQSQLVSVPRTALSSSLNQLNNPLPNKAND